MSRRERERENESFNCWTWIVQWLFPSPSLFSVDLKPSSKYYDMMTLYAKVHTNAYSRSMTVFFIVYCSRTMHGNELTKTKQNQTNQTSSFAYVIFFLSNDDHGWRSSSNTSIAVRDHHERARQAKMQQQPQLHGTEKKHYTKITYTLNFKPKEWSEMKEGRQQPKKERKERQEKKKRQKRSRSKQWPNSLNFVENDIVAYIFLSFNSFVVFISLVFVQDRFRCVREQTMNDEPSNNERQQQQQQQR